MFLSFITFFACNDDQLNVRNWDGNTVEGGLLDVKNTSLNYVVGNPGPYTANLRVYQGAVKSTSIRINKTFYSGNYISNTVENFMTIDISDTSETNIISYSFNFSEMIAGLTGPVGNPLPDDDTAYQIGDYWVFEYFTTTSNGEHKNYSSTKTTVSTRFAGTYNILVGDYWRIGEYRPDVAWPPQLIIESVNAEIYKHIGVGGFLDDGGIPNDFYFTVDADTGAITVMDVDPDGNAVVLNGQPIMTCELFTFESAPCEGSNIAVKNDETGEDSITITVGYFTSGSGPREFYEELQKVVD